MSDSGRLGEVRAALVAMVGPEVTVAVWGIDVMQTVHDPVEEGFIEKAVEKRKVEFRRGRACARAALDILGAPAGPIAVGESREPLWPEGFVGSITHCDDVVAAAVARRSALVGLGVDVERAAPLDAGALELALTPPEIERLGAPWRAAVVFSAKESIFKAVFPTTKRWVGFDEVELTVRGGDAGSFAGTLLGARDVAADDTIATIAGEAMATGDAVAPVVGSVLGTWRRAGDYVVTAGRLPVARHRSDT